jgi:hypothetical protein
MAILKETSSDGRVVCNSVKNMKKSGDGGAPFLLGGTRYGVYSFDTYSSAQTTDDSLDAFQDRMVEVGTWVFDHNGLFGEVDRGNVTWAFADDGTMTIEDTDETRTVTYSLAKYCGGYGKIAERDVAYLKVESGGILEDCYIIIDMYEVGPPEEKILGLMSSNGDNISLIPAK